MGITRLVQAVGAAATESMIFSSISHSTEEAFAAASHAANWRSKTRLAADFIISRLLKHVELPNYNALRCILMDGLKVDYRFNRGDLQSLKEVFFDHSYDVAIPFQPRTILDLGANIGMASLWLWQKYQPEKIIAVEPDPSNAEIAARNLSGNAVRSEVLRAAVGSTTGTAWLAQRAESNLGEVLSRSPTNSKTAIEVPVIGIAELMARFGNGGVDLVKMDIEGAEGALLGGDLAWLGGVRALVVEFHADRVDSAKLIQRVQAAGFTHSQVNVARQENLSLFVRKY